MQTGTGLRAALLGLGVAFVLSIGCSAGKKSPHVSSSGGSSSSAAGAGGIILTGGVGGMGTGGFAAFGFGGMKQQLCDQPDAGPDCMVTSAPGCGDGKVNLAGEECDDGNSIPGDGCSGVCKVEKYWMCPTEGMPCVSTIVCGDGVVGAGEACDDGNKMAGDGCAADCRSVEKGFACTTPGSPCVRTHVCGDGNVDTNEGCDDGNNTPMDGCDARCRIEVGFKCDGMPSKCTATVCGDGKKEGAESCDDGNKVPFDGCSETCQAEPTCTAGSGCTSKCGDGIVLGEQCDDGNLRDGDGCSSTCMTETASGFQCDPGPPCVMDAKGNCTITVPAIFRDQDETKNADFANNKPPNSTAITGIVNTQLAADNKPTSAGLGGYGSCTLATGCINSAATFNQWYHDTAGINVAFPGSVVLYRGTDGKFVNRWGPNGEQWQAVPPQTCSNSPTTGCSNAATDCPAGGTCTNNINWCANAGATCADANCAAAVAAGATCFNPCTPWGGTQTQLCTARAFPVDGTPLFFPIDNLPGLLPGTRASAQIPQPVYWGNWADEPGKPLHNFGFTSEIRYWFKYDSAAPAATLDFVGDDDVWVFVNGKLALDIGGWHVPIEKSFTLNAAGATTFNLKNGQVYQIAIFHAERMVTGSSFKLTLSGFDAAPSDCHAQCGDGKVAPGEACDNGTTAPCTGPNGACNNDTAYNGCTTQCLPGPHCGDGVTQMPDETCDDGVNAGGYPTANNTVPSCGPNCQPGPYCGDGVPQIGFEQCDDAVNNGDYGTCNPNCTFAPHCGDGIVQADHNEECDDMNNTSGDGCSSACKTEMIK